MAQAFWAPMGKTDIGDHHRMSGNKLENINVASQEALITPEALKQAIPLSEAAAETVSPPMVVVPASEASAPDSSKPFPPS